MMKTAVQVVRGIAPIALALGVVLASQVVMPFTGSAGAATSGGGVLTVGTDLLSGTTVGAIEFDPTLFPVSAGNFAYDWPIYAGLLPRDNGRHVCAGSGLESNRSEYLHHRRPSLPGS